MRFLKIALLLSMLFSFVMSATADGDANRILAGKEIPISKTENVIPTIDCVYNAFSSGKQPAKMQPMTAGAAPLRKAFTRTLVFRRSKWGAVTRTKMIEGKNIPNVATTAPLKPAVW